MKHLVIRRGFRPRAGGGEKKKKGVERVVGCKEASNSVGDDSQKFVGATVVSIP